MLSEMKKKKNVDKKDTKNGTRPLEIANFHEAD